MHRRRFNQTILTATMGVGLARVSTQKFRRVIKPARLQKRDTVGVLSPASPIREGQLSRAIEQIESMGWRPVIGKHVESADGYLAGDDIQRLQDIRDFVQNDEIKAIWCVRGGYGVSRILPYFDSIYAHSYAPKLVIGYSDITAWHLYLANRGLTSIHAQVAGASWTDGVSDQLRIALEGRLSGTKLEANDDLKVIVRGQARGRLVGGNLSLLTALIGTPWMPRMKNRLVYIEDVGEKPYRIDRMLTQLIQATDISQAAGIALGLFADCEAKEGENSWSLMEVLIDRLAPLKLPCCYGLPFGHVENNLCIPNLVKAELDAEAGTLTYQEEVVL